MDYDVFISHSTVDKAVADAICHTLEDVGVRCWIAPRDIAAGEDYGGEIIKGIKNCKIFLLVFSDDSNNSVPVQKEIERATLGYQKTIIPFRLEDVPFSDAIEFYLGNVHWIDAYPDKTVFKDLVVAVKNALGMNRAHEETEIPEVEVTTRKPFTVKVVIVATFVIVMAIVIAAVLIVEKLNVAEEQEPPTSSPAVQESPEGVSEQNAITDMDIPDTLSMNEYPEITSLDGKWGYILFNDNAFICRYDGNTTLVIPSVIDGVTVAGIADLPSYTGSIIDVVLPEGIVKIGSFAFAGVTATNISIPETVTSIGAMAFYMSNIQDIYIPKNVDAIGGGAFATAYSLTEVTIDPRNKNFIIEDGILYDVGKTSLISSTSLMGNVVIVPDTVTSIAEFAFSDAEHITSITLPQGLLSIGTSAFYGCLGLKSIRLPDNLISADASSFSSFSDDKLTLIVTKGSETEKLLAQYGISMELE